MKNLTGVEEAGKLILEELETAKIPALRRPVRGKLGHWTFERKPQCWATNVSERSRGLPLEVATELHEKQYPLTEDIVLKAFDYIRNIEDSIFINNNLRKCYEATFGKKSEGLTKREMQEELLFKFIRRGRPKIYGEVIKVEDLGLDFLHPRDYALPPDEVLKPQLEKLKKKGKLEEYPQSKEEEIVSEHGEKYISTEDLAKLCNLGLIKGERYIDKYYIDTQEGLNEFARTVKEFYELD